MNKNLQILVLLLIMGCGSKNSEPSNNSVNPESPHNTVITQDQIMDFGVLNTKLTEAADDTQSNVIESDQTKGVHGVTATFNFNSGSFTTYYFDPDLSIGFCTGSVNPYYDLSDGRVVPQQLRFSVVANTEYAIKIHFGLNCDSFRLKFGLRKIKAGQ